ncbi:hypothetical protein AHF37_06226 [Paragonimus kellicotti]|nr:hypothetical protein AHF37_06226 [Paragonimus kellicotti]
MSPARKRLHSIPWMETIFLPTYLDLQQTNSAGPVTGHLKPTYRASNQSFEVSSQTSLRTTAQNLTGKLPGLQLRCDTYQPILVRIVLYKTDRNGGIWGGSFPYISQSPRAPPVIDTRFYFLYCLP